MDSARRRSGCLFINIDMKITISMQNQLWQERIIPGPGYNVTEILDDIESAREAGTIPWVNWDQPLRLDIQIVEQV